MMKNIKDFFQYYREAAFQKDIPGMISLYDEEIVIFDMWSKGFSSGLSEWSSTITKWLSSLNDERVRVEFDILDLQEGDQVGFANAIIHFHAVATEGTVLRSMKNRISVGFVRRSGTWKVKHQHTSAPIDSNLKAVFDI